MIAVVSVTDYSQSSCSGGIAGAGGEALRPSGGHCSGLPALQKAGAQRHQAREHLNLWQGVSQGQAVRLRHDAARRLAGEARERHHPVHGARALRHVQARGLLRGLQHRRVGLRSAAVLHADRELPLGEGHAVRHFLRGVCALAEAADQRGAIAVAQIHRRSPAHVPKAPGPGAGAPLLRQRGVYAFWPPLDAGWPGGRKPPSGHAELFVWGGGAAGGPYEAADPVSDAFQDQRHGVRSSSSPLHLRVHEQLCVFHQQLWALGQRQPA